MSRTVNDIIQRLRGAVLSPEEALEVIAAAASRVRTPPAYHNGHGAIHGAIQGTIPGSGARPSQPDGIITGRVDYPSDAERCNQRGDYVHPAARPIPG